MDDEKLLLGIRTSAIAQRKEEGNIEDIDLLAYDESSQITLPVSILKKHISILGASGSGKTVLGKVLVEEATILGIPSIIIDPQGDLASLAIIGKKGTIEAEGTSSVSYANYLNRAEVRIFTPASTKGIPLSINPLRIPPPNLPKEDFIRALDLVCVGLVRILGYKIGTNEAKAAKNFLFEFLKRAWQSSLPISDFSQFSDMVLEPEKLGLKDPSSIITDRERKRLSKNLKYLSMGMDQLLFNFGVPVDIGAFLNPVENGKVPVNVIYLNTLTSEEHKQFFVAIIAREIYTYMLQHPSKDVQLLFLVDEIAPYLPPHPRKPPAKEMLKLLFKQGRKYGVSCIMCTQNPADVDYKAMSQANTWALGRMMAKQDMDKVKHMLRSGPLTRHAGLLAKL
ncbi:MAG: ATP-binding protein, partial [Thermoplasmata archaeon]|nr:ATP-binding protein [Thermoplasmata archaeon]